MPTASTLICFCYTICDSKRTFKSKAGLQRHESLKHSNYKKISAHILLIPEHELQHIKNTMIKELQNQLKIITQKLKTRFFQFIAVKIEMRGFSDKSEHRCKSGEVTFRFIVDQGQF
ncbi:2828_t:CDS:2 [Dentiscutata heterogama]|uniref:2828_t:CDS:1 n=1 Tax=Dentiscutata heterogama TaxID=1316150 RepID=A0ACA9MTH3_9GLOM|nr:2828_t:CDS:2 [Dentiscutata heterogama]